MENGKKSEHEPVKENQWENIFREEGEVFTELQEDMPKVVELLKKEGVRDVLDLGCGAGRHSVYLAEQGFNVSGIDASPSGIEITKRRLDAEKLSADLKIGDIYERLPYPDNSFQAIVSTQVLHHNRIEKIRELIKEMKRILGPNGIIFVTVAEMHDSEEEEIAPNTFVPLSGGEKGLIHYYFDEKSLRDEFINFDSEIWEEAGGGHYCLLGKLKNKK